MATLTKEQIIDRLRDVTDPEIGLSVVDMELIDDVEIKDGQVTLTFHLTSPFCPPVFATMIGRDIKGKLAELPGVEGVTLKLVNHVQAELINKEINK